MHTDFVARFCMRHKFEMWDALDSAWSQYIDPVLNPAPLPQHVVVNLESRPYEHTSFLELEFALCDGPYYKKLFAAALGRVELFDTILFTHKDLKGRRLTLEDIDTLVKRVGLHRSIVEFHCSPVEVAMISHQLNAVTPYVVGLYHSKLRSALGLDDTSGTPTTSYFETNCSFEEQDVVVGKSIHLHVSTERRIPLSERHRAMILQEMESRGLPTQYFIYIQPTTTVEVGLWNCRHVRRELEKHLRLICRVCSPTLMSISVEGDPFVAYCVGEALQDSNVANLVAFDMADDMSVML